MATTAVPRSRARRTRLRGSAAVLGVAVALLVPACVRPPAGPMGVPASQPAPPAQPSQVWRADGYGRDYVLQGTQLQAYQTTKISCIPEKTFDRMGAPEPNGAQSFGTDGFPEVTLRGEPGGPAVFHELGTMSNVDLLPIPALPASCSQQLPKDPLTTFDVFWASVAEQYNSLRRKNIDWAAQRDRYRPLITADTSSKELFGIMRSMIEPFGDMHTGLESRGDVSFEGKRPGTVDLEPKQTDAAIDHFLLTQGATGYITFGSGQLVYADLPNGRGYLRIDGFEDLTEDSRFVADEAEVTKLLDTVFTQQRVAGWRMLIIDLRNNPGGEDQLGIDVASRLTDRPYTAYTKAARNDPDDPTKFARTQTATVVPGPDPRYTGPVRLLTGELTISAGETFTLAMMGRQPAPERFGANTQGVYADTLDRKLPNGWVVTMGNEDFFAADGTSYEGPGIPPTTPIPVFPPAELAANQDSVLAAALR